MDIDPWVPVIALLIGFVLSPFSKRSEVRNTLRIEAGDQLAYLYRTLLEAKRDGDRQAFRIELQRLRLRLRAVGMPDSMVTALYDEAAKTWKSLDPGKPLPSGTSMSMPRDFFVVTEFVAMWLGSANPVTHLKARFLVWFLISGRYDKYRQGKATYVGPELVGDVPAQDEGPGSDQGQGPHLGQGQG